MPLVLKYFELNALAEPIRYILYYTGQKFTDVRYDFKNWPVKEIKDGLPFGQLPILEDGDRVLNQTVAIARYVSVNTELLPLDPYEQAVLDSAALNVFDFHKHTDVEVLAVAQVQILPQLEELWVHIGTGKYHQYLSCHDIAASLDVVNFILAKKPDEKAEFRKKLFDEYIDFFYSRFEKMLKDNNGYFGGKLSWADFILVGITECANLFLGTEIEKGYPTVIRLLETVRALPGVRDYIKDRKPYVL